MDGPSNFVVDYCYTTGSSGNYMIAIYWKLCGPTCHINNPKAARQGSTKEVASEKQGRPWLQSCDLEIRVAGLEPCLTI